MPALLIASLFNLNGLWISTQGTTDLATEQGTVHYENCSVQANLKLEAQVLHIDGVKANCTHSTYYAFGEKLPSFDLPVLADGTVKGPNGMKAGTLSSDRLSIRFELDGKVYFIDANTTSTGIHFEWSERGFEGLTFDVTAECVK